MGKTATLTCWQRSHDGLPRDLADTIASVTVPQRRAIAIAREIDQTGGSDHVEGRFAAGHGVLVRYASGRTRLIRAWAD